MKPLIVQALEDYDGKHVSVLADAARQSPSHADMASLLLALERNARYEEAGPWLLKAWAENGIAFSEDLVKVWFQTTQTLKHWSAHLHFCQALHHFHVSSKIESEIF